MLSQVRRAENKRAFRMFQAVVGTHLETADDTSKENPEDSFITEKIPIIHIRCECSDENCSIRIPIATEEYQKIHVNEEAFIIFPKHQVDINDVLLTESIEYGIVKQRNCTPEYTKE